MATQLPPGTAKPLGEGRSLTPAIAKGNAAGRHFLQRHAAKDAAIGYGEVTLPLRARRWPPCHGWEQACLFEAEVAEALIEVAASVAAAAAATTTSEVEAAAISEAAAEEDLDEGAAAEVLTKARTKDLQSK
ncbi:hypothetical protein J1605_011634 [Eschrichtius robustus]|uniref:Uncharacterized protein n=1 Tax=Eschrichtius robustus TaxID=9764 RepID=A0AB34GNX5_ESCRO|nr:hypothetical protein J1605_011634 [Eschrichtius robustus]